MLFSSSFSRCSSRSRLLSRTTTAHLRKHYVAAQRLQVPRPMHSSSATAWSVRPTIRSFHTTTVSLLADDNSHLPYHLVVGLPALSPTMDSGTLAEWYIGEGEKFMAGDALAKIETDKASVDYEAQDDGYCAKILVKAGQEDLAIGKPIMVTVEEEEDVAAFKDFKPPDEVAPPPPSVEEPETKPAPKPAVAAAAPPPPTPVAAAVEAPATPTTPPPPPPPPASAAAAVAPDSISKTSPIAKKLALEQMSYIEKYGNTGQKPITIAA